VIKMPNSLWLIDPALDSPVDAPQPHGVPTRFLSTEGISSTGGDHYRYVQLQRNDHILHNTCFVDRCSLIGLKRIIEGDVATISDLAAAECALQAILFHESCSVLTPTVAFDTEPAGVSPEAPEHPFGSYMRLPDSDPSGASVDFSIDGALHEILTSMPSTAYLAAPERVTVRSGNIVASTMPNSPLLGGQASSGGWTRGASDHHWAAAASIPLGLGVPSYIADLRMFGNAEAGKFIHAFYKAVNVPWGLIYSPTTSASATIEIPWLLSLVLNRAYDRSSIPRAIVELRDELSQSRDELKKFNDHLNASTSQSETEAFCREIENVFSATVSAAAMTNTEKRRQRIFSAYRTGYQALKIADHIAPGGLHPLVTTFKNLFKIPFTSPSPLQLVDRTITSRTFYGLIGELESLSALLPMFLTDGEMYKLRLDRAKRAQSS